MWTKQWGCQHIAILFPTFLSTLHSRPNRSSERTLTVQSVLDLNFTFKNIIYLKKNPIIFLQSLNFFLPKRREKTKNVYKFKKNKYKKLSVFIFLLSFVDDISSLYLLNIEKLYSTPICLLSRVKKLPKFVCRANTSAFPTSNTREKRRESLPKVFDGHCSLWLFVSNFDNFHSIRFWMKFVDQRIL